MKQIISRTLETTVKKVSIILAIAVGVFAGYFVSYVYPINSPTFVYDKAIGNVTIYQHLMIFVLITGTTLMMLASSASGMIAAENAEGTLRLLVAKPNTRTQILFSKIIGTVTGVFVLFILALSSYYISVMFIFGNYDGAVIREMMAYLPGYIVYGLIVIFIFGGIASLFSVVSKKKVIALLPVLAILVIIFAGFPIIRMICDISGKAISSNIDYIDMNYHLSLIFKNCINLFSELKLTAGGSTVSMLMKLFVNKTVDVDIALGSERILVEYNALNSYIVMAIYMILGLLSYLLSFIIIRKKDV